MFSAVGQLLDITPSPLSRAGIPTTTHGDSDTKRIPGGVLDAGDATFRVLHDPVNQAVQGTILAGLNAGRIDQWTIEEPGGRYSVFTGFATSRTISLDREGPVAHDVTISPDGGVQTLGSGMAAQIGVDAYTFETDVSLASALDADLLEAGDIRRIGGTTPTRLAIEPQGVDTVASLVAGLNWPGARIRIRTDASNHLDGTISRAIADAHGMVRVDVTGAFTETGTMGDGDTVTIRRLGPG